MISLQFAQNSNQRGQPQRRASDSTRVSQQASHEDSWQPVRQDTPAEQVQKMLSEAQDSQFWIRKHTKLKDVLALLMQYVLNQSPLALVDRREQMRQLQLIEQKQEVISDLMKAKSQDEQLSAQIQLIATIASNLQNAHADISSSAIYTLQKLGLKYDEVQHLRRSFSRSKSFEYPSTDPEKAEERRNAVKEAVTELKDRLVRISPNEFVETSLEHQLMSLRTLAKDIFPEIRFPWEEPKFLEPLIFQSAGTGDAELLLQLILDHQYEARRILEESVNKKGWTPIHIGASEGGLEWLQTAQREANVNLWLLCQGQYPADLARESLSHVQESQDASDIERYKQVIEFLKGFQTKHLAIKNDISTPPQEVPPTGPFGKMVQKLKRFIEALKSFWQNLERHLAS